MKLQRLLLLPMLLCGTAEAQVLTFDGDGFEACPHGAIAVESLSSWNGVFGPFPQVPQNNQVVVPSGGSTGLFLAAPNTLMNGQLQVQLQPTTIGEAVLSLSPCASVFPANPASCVSTVSATPALQWTTNPAGTGCRLQPGVNYYFNVTFGSQTAPGNGQPWCSSGSCGVKLVSTTR